MLDEREEATACVPGENVSRRAFCLHLVMRRSPVKSFLTHTNARMTRRFQSTIDLFDEYYRGADRIKLAGFNRDLAVELRERLEQLGWLVDQIRALEERSEAAMTRAKLAFSAHVERLKREGLDFEKQPVPEDAKVTREEARDSIDAQFQMKLYSESFYYLAGRARALLRNKDEPLPGLGGFESRGVRDVRNHLLEHPEGSASRIFIASWAWGGPQGPVMKSIRYAGQEDLFRDAGLYVNASEFIGQLEMLLGAALRKMGV